MDRESVVLVGDRWGFRLPRLRLAFEVNGFHVDPCAGGASSSCPALAGGDCGIEGRPAGVVIVRTYGETIDLSPVCRQALGVPVVVIEQGSAQPMQIDGEVARMGESLGPWTAVHALETLLERAGQN